MLFGGTGHWTCSGNTVGVDRSRWRHAHLLTLTTLKLVKCMLAMGGRVVGNPEGLVQQPLAAACASTAHCCAECCDTSDTKRPVALLLDAAGASWRQQRQS